MSAAQGLPTGAAKTAAVRGMFDRIAPRYDLLNAILTFGLDGHWRRRALRAGTVTPGALVVDVAAGTGDFCRLLAEAGCRPVAVDPSLGMLAVARTRLPDGTPLVAGCAEQLPLPRAGVDAVTCGFALRNFTDLPAALAEMARVLRPGGRLVLLDVAAPTGRLRSWGHRIWFHRMVPLIGGLLSNRAAYAYLPASAAYLPAPAELDALVAAAGFVDVRRRSLGLGAVAAITATRGPR